MGVPKFFRWISERYPTISQLIAENRIPEFDNLYVRTPAISPHSPLEPANMALGTARHERHYPQLYAQRQ